MADKFRSGFVAVVGRPNVGKSTLINAIIGRKVSIISPKPQTTRNQIKGVYTSATAQIIFIDTPGIHKPRHELGRFMNKEAFASLSGVDLILYIIDAAEDFSSGEEFIIERLNKSDVPVIMVVNKIDLVKDKNRLLENIVKYDAAGKFTEVYYVSALRGDNLEKVLTAIEERLPEGPKYYPGEVYSDRPEQFIIAELIREKALLLTKEEVPHSLAVVTEEGKTAEDNPDLTEIRATIYVERPSQKKIIIGAGGKMLKEIGTLARKEIVMLFGNKVYLELWVKVADDWRNKKAELKRMGYFLE
ncbi:MAG TPA: GTPase Era [Acholeplasmataceae bacterium]|jgi:GTP-binding protein Era|nr:GTPase Era [Acholeplasmataceae bacterium]